ncbi:MAG TPA: aminopeptidase P family protein [Acidobacteriota bacterium]|nr:aminopeptidase P family protein [Acidobacteriota bacterium]
MMMAKHNVEVNWAQVYRERRNRIREAVGGGVILWLGHMHQPRNYADNTFTFRQNSHFLYYTGLSEPDLALLSFPERDYDVLFSKPVTVDDIVWSGPGYSRVDMARDSGVDTVEDLSRLGVYLTKAGSGGQKIHYLPQYQASSLFRVAELLVTEPSEVNAGVSQVLLEAVAQQRLSKTEPEIAEIEDALCVTDGMYRSAMACTRPGLHEYDVAGALQAVALSKNRQQAYTPIVTVHGEVLHNHTYDHPLDDGQLLLIDAGAESPRFYASDITRTFPTNGRFTSVQAEVYQTVLRMQLGAISAIKPGLTYRDIHIASARILVEGLRSMNLMKGDPADAVAAGAHALFYPHGLGHMLGLDVHDMEDLGDVVGYPKGEKRSAQFGLNYLRLSRPLEPGYVLTVEPGIYFIPALIDRWQQERLHRDYICYEKLDDFRTFGGIRIEDDVVVTPAGARVLGPGIPKTIPEVEEAMGNR